MDPKGQRAVSANFNDCESPRVCLSRATARVFQRRTRALRFPKKTRTIRSRHQGSGTITLATCKASTTRRKPTTKRATTRPSKHANPASESFVTASRLERHYYYLRGRTFSLFFLLLSTQVPVHLVGDLVRGRGSRRVRERRGRGTRHRLRHGGPESNNPRVHKPCPA